jgi:hypothetical protein
MLFTHGIFHFCYRSVLPFDGLFLFDKHSSFPEIFERAVSVTGSTIFSFCVIGSFLSLAPQNVNMSLFLFYNTPPEMYAPKLADALTK